ncbi:MAG: ABC transporter ATP-binding protein [Lewinella sp.]
MITTTNLSYRYTRQEPTLQNLNLHVPAGSIYGFLGANGAGKSTTIRNLLGLLRSTSGDIQIFGQPLLTERPSILRRVGALIEAPSLYPQLTAVDNLRIACDYRSISPNRIAPVLDQVGLTGQERKRTHKFSMGMKQRLGLALALLHDPELLILDEPTNGLDPSGISDIRQLLLALQAAGKTIMLSSHLLPEIEKTVTHLGIIRDGQMLFQGTLPELEALRSTNLTVEIKTPNAQRGAKLLGIEQAEDNGVLLVQLSSREELPDLIRKLVLADIDLYAVRSLAGDLESQFLQLTNHQV